MWVRGFKFDPELVPITGTPWKYVIRYNIHVLKSNYHATWLLMAVAALAGLGDLRLELLYKIIL
jgi:hypothetical protein